MSDFGLFDAVKGLFEYNRENFIFDRTMNQTRVYQIQKMRVAQVKLYRDDLRELFDLTIRKMDSYLIFTALLLLFTGGLFYEGQLPKGTPAWLLWLWTMALGSAFFYLSLAIWFSIHASITAQTFQVRVLTQWLRLPIPSAEDIHAVAGAATEFEETRAKDMLRVPGVDSRVDAFKCVEKYPDIPNELLESDIVEDYSLFVEHFYLFRELQKHWQSFDAYCRVGMVVGTNMLLSAFSYMSIAYFLMSFKNFGALAFPLLFTGFQLIHLKINLRNLSKREIFSIVALNTIPVILACIAGIQSILDNDTFYGDVLSPVMYAVSGLWIVQLVLLGSEENGGLPNRFVTVSSIDVLGLDEDDGRFLALSPTHKNERETQQADSPSSQQNSDREGADTPVAVAVPTAPVISMGEERRRKKSVLFARGGSCETSEVPQTANMSSKQISDNDIDLLYTGEDVLASAYTVQDVLASVDGPYVTQDVVGDVVSEHPDEAAQGIAPCDQTEKQQIRAYKASLKAQLLPWKNFREAGAVLVCLWLFSTTYAVLASYETRWGWPRSQPYGDGEEDEEPVAPVANMAPVAAQTMHAYTTQNSNFPSTLDDHAHY